MGFDHLEVLESILHMNLYSNFFSRALKAGAALREHRCHLLIWFRAISLFYEE
jgi:hypothetical protein